jgi:hypothetical protein
MGEVSTIGEDLTKSVFQVHGADASGAVLFPKKPRHQVLTFFAAQPRCTVAMEACGSAHHRAREIGRLGHGVRHSQQVGIVCCPGPSRAGITRGSLLCLGSNLVVFGNHDVEIALDRAIPGKASRNVRLLARQS